HPRHKALFDFADANAGMLSLEAGKVYTILERNDTGWWLGSYNGAEGWIPSNYLSPEPEPEAAPRQAQPVLPRPPAMRNGANGGAAAAAGAAQGSSMAQLAAALASRSPNGGSPHQSAHAPPRPAANRYAQEDSDEEEAWE
ncbi:class II myosin, partial [Coemansia nantahalensis]